MLLAFLHPISKEPLLVPVTQVVVYNDSGAPVAISYEHAGLLIHSDVSHDDFAKILRDLRVGTVEVDHGG